MKVITPIRSRDELESSLSTGLDVNYALAQVELHWPNNETDAAMKVSNIDLLLARGANFKEVSIIHPDQLISLDYAKFMLSNGLQADVLLGSSFVFDKDPVLREQFIDLALEHNPKFEDFYITTIKNFNINDLEKLLKHGMTLNKASDLIIDHIGTGSLENEAAKKDLLSVLLEKGGNFSEVNHSNFGGPLSIEFANYLLINGLKPEVLLVGALESPEKEKNEPDHNLILKLALENNPDFSKIQVESWISISNQDFEQILNSGLTLDKISSIVFRDMILEDEDKEAFGNFVNLLVSKGAKFSEIKEVSCTYNLDTYKILLDNGLNPEILLKHAQNSKDSLEYTVTNLIKYYDERFPDLNTTFEPSNKTISFNRHGEKVSRTVDEIGGLPDDQKYDAIIKLTKFYERSHELGCTDSSCENIETALIGALDQNISNDEL